MFKKYIKKPVEIEAMEFNDTRGDIDILKELIGKEFISKVDGYFIKTLEGEMKISQGDFIIRGIKGEYYPCKPDIFEASYEKSPDNRGFKPKEFNGPVFKDTPYKASNEVVKADFVKSGPIIPKEYS